MDGVRDYLDKVKHYSFKAEKKDVLVRRFDAVLSRYEKWYRVKEYLKLSQALSKVQLQP